MTQGGLECKKEGLISEEGKRRHGIFGPNKLEEKKGNFIILVKF